MTSPELSPSPPLASLPHCFHSTGVVVTRGNRREVEMRCCFCGWMMLDLAELTKTCLPGHGPHVEEARWIRVVRSASTGACPARQPLCSVCGSPQFRAFGTERDSATGMQVLPGAVTCSNGHAGAPPCLS